MKYISKLDSIWYLSRSHCCWKSIWKAS